MELPKTREDLLARRQEPHEVMQRGQNQVARKANLVVNHEKPTVHQGLQPTLRT
jgi:hypothetical protein